jgi:hypothetical protein
MNTLKIRVQEITLLAKQAYWQAIFYCLLYLAVRDDIARGNTIICYIIQLVSESACQACLLIIFRRILHADKAIGYFWIATNILRVSQNTRQITI